MKVLRKILIGLIGSVCIIWAQIAMGQGTGFQVHVGGNSRTYVTYSAFSQDSTLVCLYGNFAVNLYDSSGHYLSNIFVGERIFEVIIPRGNKALYCLANGKIFKFSLPEGKLQWHTSIHANYQFMRFSDDGKKLFCIGKERDGQPLIQVNLKNGKPQRIFYTGISVGWPDGEKDRKWDPEYLAIRPDGSAVCVINKAVGKAEIFMTEGGKMYQVTFIKQSWARSSLHPYRPEIAIQTEDSLTVTNWETRQRLLQVRSMVDHIWPVNLNFSRDGKLLYNVSDEGILFEVEDDPYLHKDWRDTLHIYNTEEYAEINKVEFVHWLKDLEQIKDSLGLNYCKVTAYDRLGNLTYQRSFPVGRPLEVQETLISPGGRWTAIRTVNELILWDNKEGHAIWTRLLPDKLKGRKLKIDPDVQIISCVLQPVEPSIEFSANDSFLLFRYGKIEVLDCFMDGKTIYTDSAMKCRFQPQGRNFTVVRLMQG